MQSVKRCISTSAVRQAGASLSEFGVCCVTVLDLGTLRASIIWIPLKEIRCSVRNIILPRVLAE